MQTTALSTPYPCYQAPVLHACSKYNPQTCSVKVREKTHLSREDQKVSAIEIALIWILLY